MPRRFAPPPPVGRKPPTGAPRRDGHPAPVIGQRLAYLRWLAQTRELAPLAEQELRAWRAWLAQGQDEAGGGMLVAARAWARRMLARVLPRRFPAAIPAGPR